ncbi:MAG: M28 family peptidase, partial [Anaerolineaceae bacterium]
CHPRSSANDNASGVAAGMEAVRVLKGLTETGQLARLKRGIRVIFVPEFTGTYAYLHELGGARGKIKAGINLDMVGGRQVNGYGPITISGLPHANPSFVVDLAALVMDEVRRNQPAQGKDNTSAMFNGKVGSFETGSDHYVLSDPTINIPSIMLGQWPDKFYHTSGDTPEVVDPFILHKSTTICAGYIYLLANLALEDVPLILNKSVDRVTEELGELVKRGAGKQMESGLLYRKMQHLTEFYKGCNRSLTGFFSAADEPALQTRIERTNKLLEQTADTLWIGYVDAFAPGFEVTDEPVPAVYRYVPVRKYVTPVSHLDDHALGDPQKLAACKDHTKNHAAKLHSAHYFDGVVQFYIDGQRSLWEIAQEAMLETGDGSVEYVDRFVKLLASLDLVEIN